MNGPKLAMNNLNVGLNGIKVEVFKIKRAASKETAPTNHKGF